MNVCLQRGENLSGKLLRGVREEDGRRALAPRHLAPAILTLRHFQKHSLSLQKFCLPHEHYLSHIVSNEYCLSHIVLILFVPCSRALTPRHLAPTILTLRATN